MTPGSTKVKRNIHFWCWAFSFVIDWMVHSCGIVGSLVWHRWFTSVAEVVQLEAKNGPSRPHGWLPRDGVFRGAHRPLAPPLNSTVTTLTGEREREQKQSMAEETWHNQAIRLFILLPPKEEHRDPPKELYYTRFSHIWFLDTTNTRRDARNKPIFTWKKHDFNKTSAIRFHPRCLVVTSRAEIISTSMKSTSVSSHWKPLSDRNNNSDIGEGWIVMELWLWSWGGDM
jgi:hypothetical protein